MFKHYNPNINHMVNKIGVEKKLEDIRRANSDMVVGAVRIFKDGEIIQDITQNLVVALGRQYVASRIFGIAHPSETSIPTGSNPNVVPVWDWKVTHFGLGNGGAVVVGNYVNLLGPEICDEDLYNPLPLSGNPGDPAYLTSPGDPLKGVSKTNFVIKPIRPTGTLDIIRSRDIDCLSGPKYSYVRVVCSKFPGEPNYLQFDNDYMNINEAGLYYTDVADGGQNVRMFAHICFAPKYIEKKSELVIEWYILC